MEVFDRSLTNIPIELHTKYLSNFHIKYISVPDQFVWSGTCEVVVTPTVVWSEHLRGLWSEHLRGLWSEHLQQIMRSHNTYTSCVVTRPTLNYV
jgi:hypothetical protein